MHVDESEITNITKVYVYHLEALSLQKACFFVVGFHSFGGSFPIFLGSTEDVMTKVWNRFSALHEGISRRISLVAP